MDVHSEHLVASPAFAVSTQSELTDAGLAHLLEQ